MRQTLFTLPHFLFEGWLALAFLIIGLIVVAFQFRRHRMSQETINTLIVVAVGTAIIYFVFPVLEAKVPDPNDPEGKAMIPSGLAIRGYGFMFLMGAIGGLGITLYRSAQMGLDGDRIIGLAFWMFVAGIVGARLFYVVQYRDEFVDEGAVEWGSVVNMTEGGLVVYGSVIGGLAAGIIYLRYFKMPTFAVADVIVPGMLLGLSLGRIGCLLNGCCYGGICDWPVALKFPPGSAPYMEHYHDGELIGLRGGRASEEGGWIHFKRIASDSLAVEAGIEEDDTVRVGGVRSDYMRRAHSDSAFDRKSYIEFEDDLPYEFQLSDLPQQSRQVHPTQIYSAINAALLTGLLWFFYAYRRNDGEVFAVALLLYPISRFTLEGVRVDEGGQFGTWLTISQWVSIGMFAIGLALFIGVRRLKLGLALEKGPQKLDKID